MNARTIRPLAIRATAQANAIACLAYILGLLLTGLSLPSVLGLPVAGLVLLVGAVIAALVMPRLWHSAPRWQVWLLAGMVGLLAMLSFQWRLPQPASDDVSRMLTQTQRQTISQTLVTGFVETAPRLTRNNTWRFELSTFQSVESVEYQSPIVRSVTGTVYATVPKKVGENLMPGQMVAVTGSLYLPKPADNPGGFDFRAYLARQGIFAGMRGQQVSLPEPEGRFRAQVTGRRSLQRAFQQSLWRIRERIVRSQAQRLENPKAALVSAMLLGKNAVDLDYDLRDLFGRVGLAHALAASGFQVSLLLGILLKLTGRRSNGATLVICGSGLLIYIGLTGLEASVVRAGLMGGAVLLAIAQERKIKPLGALLAIATLMLIWNPMWIWDLGFQMSFLATLGLVVTVPILDQWLDWMPPFFTSLISVPVAAYLWTMPLQLMVFGGISPYSIPLNVATALLITLISLGSGITALVGLVNPAAGGWLTLLMDGPTQGLMALATFTDRLPGSAFSAGTISASQTVTLYGLYGLLWGLPQLWKRWWVLAVVCVGLVAVPAVHTTLAQVQMTVLATQAEPVLVVQQRGEVGLVGVGDRQDLQFTVLPFLRRQGINRINWAIALTATDKTAPSWTELRKTVSIQTLHTSTAAASRPDIQSLTRAGVQLQFLQDNQSARAGSAQIRLVNLNPLVLHLKTVQKSWLLLPKPLNRAEVRHLPQADTLLGSERALNQSTLHQVKPAVAISTRHLSAATRTALQQHQVKGLAIATDGAVQWNQQAGFTSVRDSEEFF